MKTIQRTFNKLYPNLKLEFLNASERTFRNTNIDTSGSRSNQSFISLSGDRTIAQLQEDFKNKFNVFIRVMRKTGNMWIETNLTKDWTLEQQNNEAEMLTLQQNR
jgi:hypothetical protein